MISKNLPEGLVYLAIIRDTIIIRFNSDNGDFFKLPLDQLGEVWCNGSDVQMYVEVRQTINFRFRNYPEALEVSNCIADFLISYYTPIEI